MTKSFKNNDESHNGYVLYANKSSDVLGIVSVDYKRKAIARRIPRFIKDSLICIEDKRFYSHRGVDYKAICRAVLANLERGRIVQGGSTVTQQLARALIQNNKRTFSRKFLELIKALQLELNYSKEEILDLYFNNVYWGNNLYGIRAASLYYYKKEPHQLTPSEQLALLTLLRGPNYYISNPIFAERRFQLLNSLLLSTTSLKNRHRKIAKHSIKLKSECLEIFSNQCVPFIMRSINDETKTIISTIDSSLQLMLSDWVSSSKYPVTAICIEKGKVVAVSSSFGSAHAFSSRANVGSTLKPFIYAFLRSCGFERHGLISTRNMNELGWSIREANLPKPYISLEEALFDSNNNAFVNACFSVDLTELYNYLSIVLKKDANEFIPSSILGVTKSGISLYELATCYYNYFCRSKLTQEVRECHQILLRVAIDRLHCDIDNIFLKTGTTNDNNERYAVLGNQERVLALVRGDNLINDNSKEGSFLDSVKRIVTPFFNKNASYRWNKR